MSAVTLANGEVVTSEMTPTERYNAVAKSMNAPTVSRPVAPQQFHVDATIIKLEQGDAAVGTIAGKAPPPSPKQLEKQNALPPQGDPSPVRAADFERDMAERGLARRPDGRFIAVGEIDKEAIELITENYKVLAAGAKDHPEIALRFKRMYEADVKAILDGKQLSGAQIEKLRKGAGKTDTSSFVPKAKEAAPAAPAQEHTPEQWVEAHKSVANKDGWIPFGRVNPAALSGYKLPKLITDQVMSPETFTMLRHARTAGISQAQVDTFVRAQMLMDGLITD